jgi:starch-binding outer membrane protein, SusD/RagB family
MNTKIILLLSLISVILSSCIDYLDPYPNGDTSNEELWNYQATVQGFIGACYNNMPGNYNDNEGAYFEGATDNAVLTNSIHKMSILATGALTTSQDPFKTYWDRDYKSIALINTFLKDNRGINTRFLTDKHLNSLVKSRLQGEAFALRAWFQWDLLQKFGGKGINGIMLGFPIITEPVEINSEINFARNTYDECVKQILDDCDSAYKYLSIAHRDFLVENPADKTYAGGKYWGRMDSITTRAIKALVYLTWASPRFNSANDRSRWDNAAKLAKEVMDYKLNVDGGVANGFDPVNSLNWFDPNCPDIVISSRVQDKNDAMERMFYPGGFQGNGEIGATQELVDAFPMANGRPITDPLSGYEEDNPYAARDPRFYSTIFYNTAIAKRLTGTPVDMYTFENWNTGPSIGKDAAGVSQNNSLTNYHIKKFVFMGLNFSDPSINKQPHSKFFITWTHMCLVFAEAANHAVGPVDASTYGISAKTAIQYLRSRNTPDGLPGLSPVVPNDADDYLTEVADAGETAFDALVKNERRIETCFEGMRFYDLRRWTTDLTSLNNAVHGASIVQNPDLTFTYDLNFEVQTRLYTSAYLPIPYDEMLRMSKLIQNEGWELWN